MDISLNDLYMLLVALGIVGSFGHGMTAGFAP